TRMERNGRPAVMVSVVFLSLIRYQPSWLAGKCGEGALLRTIACPRENGANKNAACTKNYVRWFTCVDCPVSVSRLWCAASLWARSPQSENNWETEGFRGVDDHAERLAYRARDAVRQGRAFRRKSLSG